MAFNVSSGMLERYRVSLAKRRRVAAVVINSGLTAAWSDWAGDFPTPRYGDYAVFMVKDGSDDPEAVYAGLFDESWKLR